MLFFQRDVKTIYFVALPNLGCVCVWYLYILKYSSDTDKDTSI